MTFPDRYRTKPFVLKSSATTLVPACMSSPKIFHLIQVQPCLGLLCHPHMTKSMHKHAYACRSMPMQVDSLLCSSHDHHIWLQTPRLHRAKPACLFHPLAYMHTHWEQFRSSEIYIMFLLPSANSYSFLPFLSRLRSKAFWLGRSIGPCWVVLFFETDKAQEPPKEHRLGNTTELRKQQKQLKSKGTKKKGRN